jgi:hypothetical protein
MMSGIPAGRVGLILQHTGPYICKMADSMAGNALLREIFVPKVQKYQDHGEKCIMGNIIIFTLDQICRVIIVLE